MLPVCVMASSFTPFAEEATLTRRRHREYLFCQFAPKFAEVKSPRTDDSYSVTGGGHRDIIHVLVHGLLPGRAAVGGDHHSMKTSDRDDLPVRRASNRNQ